MSLSDVRYSHTVIALRDHFASVDTNGYAANPRFVGRRVEVCVTLDEVTVEDPGASSR